MHESSWIMSWVLVNGKSLLCNFVKPWNSIRAYSILLKEVKTAAIISQSPCHFPLTRSFKFECIYAYECLRWCYLCRPTYLVLYWSYVEPWVIPLSPKRLLPSLCSHVQVWDFWLLSQWYSEIQLQQGERFETETQYAKIFIDTKLRIFYTCVNV